MSNRPGEENETTGIAFKVFFKPKFSWADRVYLGNMLVEVLGVMAKNTSAFDFQVEVLEPK